MNIKYRPEIDGLRTIAVLAVLIYHAEFIVGSGQLLKGGFLGVDVFFVISGFLITSLIINEYHQTGRFSITNFYERRARRLLPALLVVMLVSIPFAWKYLLPTQLIDYSKSLIASLLFGSNFYWDSTLQDYFAESSELKPFLHTWTLAVEEQYYILYPLILIGIHRWLRNHTITILAVGFLLSLQLAHWLTGSNPSFSFYMLPSRFWELLAGGILANHMYLHPRSNNNWILNYVMPVLGLLMIILSMAFVEIDNHHPGYITLLPVIGTILIIEFANKKDLVTQMLASKPFVSIGLISYSLYLWHYPIYAFNRIKYSSPALNDKLEWIILSLILSTLTYFIIEKPFRKKQVTSIKIFLTVILFASALVSAFSVYTIQQGGIKERFPLLMTIYGKNEFDNKILKDEGRSIVQGLADAAGYTKTITTTDQDQPFISDALWFTDAPEKKHKILIVGNSHGRDTFNALYQNAELFDAQFAWYMMQTSAKQAWKDKFFSSPNFKAADIILISSRFKRHAPVKALPEFIESIKKHNKKVILASNTVEFTKIGEDHVFDWYAKNTPMEAFSADELKSLFFTNMKKNVRERNKKLKRIAKEQNIPFIEKYDYICGDLKKACHGITPDGYKAFSDYGHYTLEGAKYFGRRIHELNWLGLE